MWEVSDISYPDAVRIELASDKPNADSPRLSARRSRRMNLSS